MKKYLLVVIGLMLGFSMLHAQSGESGKEQRVKGEKFSRNTIYVGVLGPAIPASLNYERIITKNAVFNVATKFGGFYSKFPNYNELNIANGSFEFNLLFGRSNHLFEMGIGWSGYYGSFYSEEQLKTKMYGVPTNTFGMHYRFQKPSNSFFFKAGFTASTILAFASNDLKELAIGNAVIFGLDKLTGEKPNFSLLSLGVGYSF